MAIEDAIIRLARAVEQQGEASAVAELLRQRKAAEGEAALQKANSDMYERWYNDYSARLRTSERSNRALRGVIARMKKARQS